MKWVWRGLLALVAVLVVAFLIFRTPDTDPAAMRAKNGAPPTQFVASGGGVTVHLRDEGPKDAPAIVLLHGSNADLHTWEPWAQALKGQYRVIRFDQVGHGLTGPDPQDDYSRDNYVADIGAVADRLGLKSFILGGNSMGGKHALAFALAHPERVTGLVLVDSGGGRKLEGLAFGGLLEALPPPIEYITSSPITLPLDWKPPLWAQAQPLVMASAPTNTTARKEHLARCG